MRWTIALLALAALAILWMGFSIANTQNLLQEERRLRQEEATKSEVLLEALIAVQSSNEREQERLDRAIRNIERIRNEPVTATCGDSVHGAIDRLRE